MSYHEIIKAWKDPEFRAGLNKRQRALLPENPAGMIELNDEDLYVAGAGIDTVVGLSCASCLTANDCPPGLI